MKWRDSMRKVNIPIFVSHRGCPHDCVFCNQKKITGQSGSVTPDEADRIIKEALETIDTDNSEVEIAFFGGSFTAIEESEQEELLAVAHKYVEAGYVCGIRLSTRPDCIWEQNLLMLKKYGVKSIELGAQSTDEDVLKLCRRGHGYEDIVKASELIKLHGFELGLQMMLGLPGDTREKSIRTARDIISLSPATTRIYPTIVVRDSALEVMYRRGEYEPLGLDEAVDLSAEIYAMFARSGIEVLRMGLMTSEEMRDDGAVAGPFHPSFGELVFSRIYLDKLREVAKKCEGDEVVLRVNPREISKVVGNRRKNIETIKNEHGVKFIVKCDESVERGKILW